MGVNMRIALIGSRELERKEQYVSDVCLCSSVSYRLAELGVVFTSGLCTDGMDGIAQKAYSKALSEGKVTPEHFEVYVGDQSDINRSPLPNRHLAIVRNPALIQQTEDIAGSVHPAWHKCNEWAKKMHSRNCHQILGYDLQTPVDAVICWTPSGRVQGGTATAIKIALKNNIPVFNLGESDKKGVLNRIKVF